MAHVSNNKLATSGDFYIHDFRRKPGNGSNEWQFGKFDLTSTDWSIYKVSSAMLTLTLYPKNDGINTDEILLGSVFNFTDYTLTNEVLIADVFIGPHSPNYNLDVPDLETDVTITVDLLDFISKNKIQNLIQGGDNNGTIWMKYSDDAIVKYAKLEVTAVQNPEPASLFLLGTGLVGLIGYRMKRK